MRLDARPLSAAFAAFLCGVGCHEGVRPQPATPVDVPHVDAATLSTEPTSEMEESRGTDVARLHAEFEALPPEDIETWCRSRVDYAGEDFERCELRVVGNGAALVLGITTSCGGDSCGVEAWLLAPQLEAPFRIPDAGGGIEAAPDASFIVVDDGAMLAPGEYVIVMTRIDVPSGRRSRFADCFSPKLSPGGRYFLCRDRSANVLRVPATGGRMEKVVFGKLSPEAVEWVPYAHLYPEPVEFLSSTEFAYEVQYKDGAIFRESVLWEE